MTNRLMRRVTAAVAAAGLALVAIPTVAAPANAAGACGLGKTCEGSLPGSLGSSPYTIKMPKKFNGTVLVYSHGYRIGTPIPAAIAVPLGFDKDPAYDKISFPAFQASLGSDVAYIGSNRADVAPSSAVEQNLLGKGYALAGTGYAAQGWATPEGVQANENLLAAIDKGAIRGVKKTMLWGSSLGGLIAATVAERNPDKVDGLLPLCGVLAGPEQAFSTAMSVLYTWKSLVAPSLKVANYASYPEALGDLGTVLATLSTVSQNSSLVSSVGFPVAQANLLAGLLGGLPTKSQAFDGETLNPVAINQGTAAAVAGGFSFVSAGQSSAAAMLQNVGGAAALGILGRFELEQRIRLSAGIPAGQNANFNDNVNVSYTRLLSPEQRGEFGDTLNATTVRENNLNTMLAVLDSTRGNAAARFPANPKAIKAVRALPAPTGKFTVPTVMITTQYDAIVPSGNQQWYYDRLAVSAKKTKGAVAQYYTEPPQGGWTVYDEGAKGPNAAASTAAATSGVGHCNFAINGGVQLTNSVRALEVLVKGGTPKAADRIMFKTAGVIPDEFFEPEPLKRPLRAR
jgi:pimeloyl-ACP methyl ester carboxylesterase